MSTKAATRRAMVTSATAYVTSRLYPPLPAIYGELAVKAVERVLSGTFTPILVEGINPLPRASYVASNGRMMVDPLELVYALKLEHMVDTYDDED